MTGVASSNSVSGLDIAGRIEAGSGVACGRIVSGVSGVSAGAGLLAAGFVLDAGVVF